MRQRFILSPGLLLLAVCVLSGCRGGKSVEANTQPTVAPPKRNPLEIKAAPALLEQVKIGAPATAHVGGTLRVAGRVEADETRMARVNSPVTGRIVELEIFEGQTVKRGQPLATIRSTELSDVQFGFLKAYSQHQLAERATARAKLLLEAGVIGEAELQRREAEMVQASAEVSSSRDQLRVLGMSQEDIGRLETSRSINSVTHIVSSIDGTVLDRKVTIGQVVQPAETVFIVADLSQVWLVADVPEQTAGSLEIGKEVEAEIAALPGQSIFGKLSFVSAIVNPETRTVRARMDLPNPHRRFKPAMLSTMMLKDGAKRENVVPVTAIVRENNQDHVYVQTSPDTFLMRPVLLGEEYGKNRVLLDGVGPGEKIVLDGAFHLNNERKRLALQGE